MAENPKDSDVSLAPVFDRYKLPRGTADNCEAFVRLRFSKPVQPAPSQGYCSYTVYVDGEGTVVQFRPGAHKLDLEISDAACDVFGSLAPETESLGTLEGTGLYAFSMKKMPGVSLANLRAETDLLQAKPRQELIIRDFAHLQAMSWTHAARNKATWEKRTVGSSLRWRLELMANGLPSRFRNTVKSILVDLSEIEALPWTLSHGDFLPSNIMVYPDSGRISGLVDWTEAEFLPFGIGMYGLQELLGEDRNGHYTYYPEAQYLRDLFWDELLSSLPELAMNPKRIALVRKAQTLGVLLWHGIAFDDGKLNRAVEEGKDDVEIERLDAFLLSSPRSGTRRLHTLDLSSASILSLIRPRLSTRAQ
ncbi:hypothetical protein GGS23DRAFT_595218 [Durotheca rogersii]|uniref:uncharacterized protein n=1 Tax=Durotheca rogersii TaxID=419775 RepID=UPI00221FFB51|nr:uncharacterized protein GGS23DRAFT_595218 [Durotheca rogersii]KAI5864486.1 hypothetical protein GGS23DRAFT_595218 [Durotheca rogersii]